MPNLRVDGLSMHQVVNATRSGEALYALYENDPDYVHEKRRRPGSLRQAVYANALGIRAPGRAARLQLDRTQAVAGGFTCYLSILSGDLFELSEAYPLVTLRASRTASTSTDSFKLYIKRASATSYVLCISATNGTPTTTSDETFSLNINTAYSLSFRWDGTVLRLTDNTTTKTITPGGAFTGPYYLDIAGDKFTSDKPRANHPVISNFSFDPTYISQLPADLSDRSPAGVDYHWELDGADGGSILAADTGTAYFLGFPAAPQLVDSALQFSSESGALQIEHSTDMDQFWQTSIKSVGRENITFYLKGTRGQEAGREVVLLDYGDLAKITIGSDNRVNFTYNGTTITSANADASKIVAGEAFTIIAGRDGTSLGLTIDAETIVTGTAPAVPYLDLERISNIYVGADEDPAVDKFFLGNLTKFALWPFATRKDAGADLATFYYDFTGDQIEDSSLNGVPAFPIPHTDEAGEPIFAVGPLDDAYHVAVEGGEVIAHSGPLDFDNSLRKRIGSDVSSLRVGNRSFLTSGNRAHVVNHLLDRTRPLGIPKPGADVTVQAVGTGALDGAYSYGYQFLSADGTVGPLKRLQPIAATDGARVILGSSDGNENESGTELDESYMTNYESGDTPGGDRVKVAWDGAPTAGLYPTEVRARLKDITEDDLKEKVHHRCVTAEDGTYTTDTLYFSTDIPTHSFNIQGNWTVQTVFQYKSPKDMATAMNGWGLWGVGKTDRFTGGTTFPSYNQDFIAYFLDGRNDAGNEVSDFYGALGRDHYGDGGGGVGGKLVVGWPRQERRESWYQAQRDLSINYVMLTFTDDPVWTVGSTYDIVFTRSGQALTVKYRNLTAGDTAYTTLTPRSMAALPSNVSGSGKTVAAKDAYSGTDFFVGYKPLTDARDFHFGTAMDYHLADLPFIGGTTTTGAVDGNADPANGQVDQANYSSYVTGATYNTNDTNNNLVKPAPGGTDGWKPMHFRVWNRAMSIADLERHSVYRSAALPGEPLNYGIFIDLGCVVEVETASTDKLTDKASGMIWFAKNEQGTGASRSPSAESLVFAEPGTAALKAPKYPILSMGTVSQTLANADLKLFVSPYGDGSYTLQSKSTGAFNLRRRIWSTLTADPQTTKLIGDFQTFISDFDQFKWFSFGLNLTANGSDRNIGADSLAINGNTVFKGVIGGTSAETVTAAHFSDAAGWIALAGHQDAATVAWETNISEFRIWNIGHGPDVEDGTDFDYVLGRVSENELANLQTYYKFQPDDESGTAITDYGTQANTATEVGNADIVDTRTTAGGGSNPAPKVAFPGAPFEDITAIRISRSFGIPINDPDDEDEVQTAVNAARGAPLYQLARIPAGSTHYVDAAPDDALTTEVPLDSGQVPQIVTAAFTWSGSLGLLTGDHDLWFSEQGPYGWETFPNWLRQRVPVTGGGGPAVAATEVNGNLLIFGTEWAVVAQGAPSAPQFTTIGAGCGATSPRCVKVYANICFTYNGTLWALADGQPVNFGLPVQDLLPDPANARLSCSSNLASLFLIDESTGTALRYHFPTQKWSVEERDATACGDLDTGEDAWTTPVGAWAQGSTTVYGDDVNAGTPVEKAGTVSVNTVTVLSGTVDAPLGTRCTVTQSDGVSVEARITAISGTPSAIVFDDLTGVIGTVKIRFGAGSTGMLVDSGLLDTGQNDHRSAASVNIHLLQSDNWEYGRYASNQPGDPSDRSSVEYTAVDTTDERLGDGSLLGRFQRVVLRNRVPEASRCTHLEVAL